MLISRQVYVIYIYTLLNAKITSDSDVSRAFSKTAGDYILIADNIDEAGNRAFMAVIAWNISL